MRRVTRGHAVASAGSLNQHSGAAAWSILVVCFCNTTSDILRAGVCVHPVFKICLILFFIFFLLSTTERTHTAPWIYSIWYPLGCLILILCLLSCAMNILQWHKRKLLYFFGVETQGRMAREGGADKNGWGRPRYYQTVLFISSFCKIRESRTQFYYFVPRLSAATVVTSRHQTAGSSMNRT